MEKIESLEESEILQIKPIKLRYRGLIEEFLKMDSKVGKMTFEYRARAKDVARMLNSWIKVDEKIDIFQKDYSVYLVKEK